MPRHSIEIHGLAAASEIPNGADLAAILLASCATTRIEPEDGDIFVITQKVVSKAEGRVVDLRTVTPSALAEEFAASARKDPRVVEMALREARRIVRMDRGILITETRHGLVCANSGVDASNAGHHETVTLLPEDPDASALRLRETLEARSGRRLAVILSDTFGRPWREGVTNVAIGISGMKGLLDYRGQTDPHGRPLTATIIAVADEIAAAAELVMGKIDGVPAAILRGYDFEPGDEGATALLRSRELDLFR